LGPSAARAGLAELAMRVNVDGLDRLAADLDGEFLTGRLLGVRAVQQTAATKDDSGGGRCCAGFQEITACSHDDCLPGIVFMGAT